MPNERITLRFVEYTPEKADAMVRVAREFAVAKLDGATGLRNGIAYTFASGWACVAYWTPTRAIVVREVTPKPAEVPHA